MTFHQNLIISCRKLTRFQESVVLRGNVFLFFAFCFFLRGYKMGTLSWNWLRTTIVIWIANGNGHFCSHWIFWWAYILVHKYFGQTAQFIFSAISRKYKKWAIFNILMIINMGVKWVNMWKLDKWLHFSYLIFKFYPLIYFILHFKTFKVQLHGVPLHYILICKITHFKTFKVQLHEVFALCSGL